MTARHLLVAQLLRPVHPLVDPAVLSEDLNPPFLISESGAWRPTAPLGRFGLVSAVSLSVTGPLEGRARGRGTPLREASQSFRAQWLLSDRYTQYNLGTYRWCEMRRLVVLLTIVALVSSVMTVLAGCGSSTPAAQPAAAPTETTSPLLKPTATVSTPLVDDSASTPTPAASVSDGIEFAPVDSFGTSGKQEPITVAEPNSPQKGGAGATGPVQGDPYTW